MPQGTGTKILLSILLLAALGAGGYWLLTLSSPATCRECRRPIHSQSRAVMEIAGRREEVCCVRCALTAGRQRQSKVTLREVADYTSSRSIAPADAWYVEGSRVLLCASHEPHLDHTKHPQARTFDRCEPSIYAFARREDADAFVAANGGTLLRLQGLMQADAPDGRKP
jgi:hypothetical protein